jgi:hypothetical protein
MSLIQIIVIILIVLWICGYGFSIGGSLIHALLVIALVIFLIDWLGSRNNIPPGNH